MIEGQCMKFKEEPQHNIVPFILHTYWWSSNFQASLLAKSQSQKNVAVCTLTRF